MGSFIGINPNDYHPTPTPETHVRHLLQSLQGTLETHDTSHVIVQRDMLETWGHLARAALLLLPHQASPEDGSPPLGCILAVLTSLFVLVLVLVMGHVLAFPEKRRNNRTCYTRL